MGRRASEACTMITGPTSSDGQLAFHYSASDPVDRRVDSHVWLMSLDEPLSHSSTFIALSSDEWSRAKSLRDRISLDRFVASCTHVRRILSNVTGLPLSAVGYDRDSCGKPRLTCSPQLFFSISHSEEHLAVAVAFGREV